MSFKWGVLDGNKIDRTDIREYFEAGLKVTAEYYGITVDELKKQMKAYSEKKAKEGNSSK